MCGKPIPDYELVYRRIPNRSEWFEPPDKITSHNFRLRTGETGLSVYRANFVTPTELLLRGNMPEGRIAFATAGAIRNLENPQGESLGLTVVEADDEREQGHAEIRHSGSANFTKAVSKALRDVFQLLERKDA